jgi:hypothetical protein
MIAAPALPPARIVGRGTASDWIMPAHGRPKAVVVYVHGWNDYSPKGKA